MNIYILICATISLLFTQFAFSFEGRVLESGQKPDDKRLGKPVTLRDYHPFRQLDAVTPWDTRKQEIVTRVKVASGILPEPTKTPLNTSISEPVEKDGFSIQSVYFESFPGHYVTGTLLTPSGDSKSVGIKNGKRPVVLCPHGHWTNGRFYIAPDAGHRGALNQIARGGERFHDAALNPILARSVQLARMGCLVFVYDMLGNADSIQFADHRRGPRKEMNQTEAGKWGFVSPQAVLRLQSNFGLQTWNSVRALDMMLELPEADGDRVLVTGASGGATQTMIASAVDDRVDASFPCVMASTAMQGGCTCENSYYLRIGQGNMDIAAAIAPKPLGLTAADDWTVELETKGHPDLVNLYQSLNAKTAYEAHFDIHFKHNYNHVSRTHMYQFVNRHFKLGLKSPVLESNFTYLTPEELTVWKKGKPANYKSGPEHERELNQVWATDCQTKVTAALKNGETADFHAGWQTIINRSLSDLGEVEFEMLEKEKLNGFIAFKGLIKNKEHQEQLPAFLYYPTNQEWAGEVTIHPTATGKAGLFIGAPSTPTDKVKSLLDDGHVVIGVDLFAQGEFLDDGASASNRAITYSEKKDLPADSWQRSPVYYYGYNDSIFVRRVHDLLSTLKMAQTSDKWEVKKVNIDAEGPLAAAALAAEFASSGAFDNVNAELKGFRFESLNDSWGEHFVPGAVRFGDVEMLRKLVQ